MKEGIHLDYFYDYSDKLLENLQYEYPSTNFARFGIKNLYIYKKEKE